MNKKIFTAEEWNKKPAQVYLTAAIEGSVIINHGNYPDVTFELVCRKRREGLEDDK